MTIGATLVASALIVLGRPSTWPLALAGFLVRGGFALVLIPIIILPTPVGLANVLAPLVEDIAFGRRSDELLSVLGIGGLALLAWLIGGGLMAAAVEGELVRRVASDDEVPGSSAGWPVAGVGRGRAWRIVAARVIVHLPFAVALIWGSIRIVAVTYRELTVPSDVTAPIAARVLTGAPDAVAAIVLAWLVGETIGAHAARRIVLLGEGLPGALRGALGQFVRHPFRGPWLTALTSAVLAAVLLVAGLAASTAWDAVRGSLAFGADPLAPVGLVVVLVALFGGGLTLVAVVLAWRSAIGTVDAAGTFGVPPGRRPGD